MGLIVIKLKKGNLTIIKINQLSCHFCALSRDRTGTGLTPLVFETNASTNSAIRALLLLVISLQSQI